MSTSNLLRLAGLSALLGGSCYVLVGAFHPANVAASVTGTRWAVVHVLACATSFFGVLGLSGVHARQATKTGWLGLVGMVLFGLATYRARIFPRAAAVLLALGTGAAPVAALLPLGSQPKMAIPVGLAIAWLGYALLAERAQPVSSVPETATKVASHGAAVEQ